MLVASAGTRRIPVAVTTADPLSRAGIASQLRGSQLIEVVEESRLDLDSRPEAVAVVVADQWEEDTARTIRGLRQRGLDAGRPARQPARRQGPAGGRRGRRVRDPPPPAGDLGQPRRGDPIGSGRRRDPAARSPGPAARPGRPPPAPGPQAPRPDDRRTDRARDRSPQAAGRRPRHGRGRRAPVPLRSDGQDDRPRRDQPARAAQPDPRRRPCDPAGPDLGGLSRPRRPLPRLLRPRAGRPVPGPPRPRPLPRPRAGPSLGLLGLGHRHRGRCGHDPLGVAARRPARSGRPGCSAGCRPRPACRRPVRSVAGPRGSAHGRSCAGRSDWRVVAAAAEDDVVADGVGMGIDRAGPNRRPGRRRGPGPR